MDSAKNQYDYTEKSFRREQIVYETYDLLNDRSGAVSFIGQDIQLKFPSDINNLSRIQLRVFKPKKLPLLEGYKYASNECTLRPYVYRMTGTTIENIYLPDYQLYSYDQTNGLLMPITEDYQFSIPFTVGVDFAKLVNDTVENVLTKFKGFAFGYIDSDDSEAHISTSGPITNHQLIELSDDIENLTIRPVYLSGAEGDFVLIYVLDLHVQPLDIYYISEYDFVTKAVSEITRLRPGNHPQSIQLTGVATKAQNYPTMYNKFLGASDNYYLILCSPYMKNLSGIVYIEGYEPGVSYKDITVSSAQQIIALRLQDPDQRVLSREEVADIYSNIWVSIDYVFENYIN